MTDREDIERILTAAGINWQARSEADGVDWVFVVDFNNGEVYFGFDDADGRLVQLSGSDFDS